MRKLFRFKSGSLLLIGFVVLCLSVLAQMMLIFFRSEDGKEEQSAQAVAEYYAADYQAERILDQLRRGEMPEEVTCQDTIYSYQCPISEEETLLVVLEKTGDDWKVLRWQAVLRDEDE